ncbi:MAG: inositol monophosphatase [Alphaproteobacteria bacterium]|nr:inositol monophosphatase [Alphaproteobacteria bacterium]
MLPDMNKIVEIVRDVALTEIMPRFGTLLAHEIRSKTHPNDLVTEADIQAELQLTRHLTRLLPGSVVVGEEGVHHDKSIFGRLSQEAPVWVLDPVDGTNNFAHGRTSFGVIVALVKKGVTVAGCIHDPVKNITITAEAGAGAWRDGQRLKVATPVPLAQMAASLGSRECHALGLRIHHLVRFASAAQDYLALIQGEVHFAQYHHLMPWDHAAGVLMHTEAGGFNAMMDGEPYRPVESDGGVLLAPDRASWKMLRPLM